MRSDLRASALALVAMTLVLGLAYPLAITGIGQTAFSGEAGGSLVERDGEVVGSGLIAQSFSRKSGPLERYFQPRPSADEYDPSATFFGNLGPNQRDLRDQIAANMKAYIALEGPYTPGLSGGDVPADAAQTSASGVDPHISSDNAEIQANRVADVRGIPVERVRELIGEATDDSFLGFAGVDGVNVLELNLALDEEPG